MRPAERTSTAVKPKTLLARQVTLTWFHIFNFLLPSQNIHLRLLSLRSEVNILRIFGWLNRHLAIGQTGQLDWNLVIKNTMAHFDWRIFVKNADWESDWLSTSWAGKAFLYSCTHLGSSTVTIYIWIFHALKLASARWRLQRFVFLHCSFLQC